MKAKKQNIETITYGSKKYDVLAENISNTLEGWFQSSYKYLYTSPYATHIKGTWENIVANKHFDIINKRALSWGSGVIIDIPERNRILVKFRNREKPVLLSTKISEIAIVLEEISINSNLFILNEHIQAS